MKKVIFISQSEAERREPVAGALALYLRHKQPISRPDRTVYALLCAPGRYEPLIQSDETQHVEEEMPLHLKIGDGFLVAIGLRR